MKRPEDAYLQSKTKLCEDLLPQLHEPVEHHHDVKRATKWQE